MAQESTKFEKEPVSSLLHGERQTVEVLGAKESKPSLTLELINLRYYNNKTYCEYQDWKDRITNKFHYS